jgi:hypothetical protein
MSGQKPKRTLPPKLKAWGQAVKELKLKPPLRKGTKEYEMVKERVAQMTGQ